MRLAVRSLQFAIVFSLQLTLCSSQLWAGEQSAALSDTEVWNEGVDSYRAGDFTNAVRLLRPLMLSKEYGARASEVVAAIAYANAKGGEGAAAASPLASLEEAAAAAQIALRASPDDPRARRNFARAAADLPALRETKKTNDLLMQASKSSPEAIVAAAIDESRALMTASTSYRTNPAPAAVALCDSLSARAERLADRWIILHQAVVQSVTNEEEAATIIAKLDDAQARSRRAAKALADFSDEAYPPLAEAEQDFYAFFKRIAMCERAIDEDLAAQSNAWQDVEAFNSRQWQPEALDWTRVFRMRFPQWAKEYEQRAQADTNMPPFTAEAQAEISALSTQLEKLQMECVDEILPPKQEEAIEIINKIKELLPKSGGQGGGQAGQGKSEANKDDKSQDSRNDQSQDDDNGEQQDLGEQQDDRQEEEEEEAAAAEEAEEEDSKDQREVEAILKKAQERADEHEAEKKARMRKAPLPPNERDW